MATPPGAGGIGIVRVSGPQAPRIARELAGTTPAPRVATLADLRDAEGEIIDHGLLLYFQAPQSYTGEHVLELHGHGGPVVMRMLLSRCVALGCRLARPGEFSERAFLNGKLDLAQAEAVADLIASRTEAAARSALRSLQGDFSRRVHELAEAVTGLRVFVEAAIDFPEEEIDFLADSRVLGRLEELAAMFDALRRQARQGKLVRDGLRVVLTGLPNAGKSSLLNALSNEARAIVSEVPGTTRDIIEKTVSIDGLPLEILDTAGIREAGDAVEAEGVRRARQAQKSADLVLMVVDDSVRDGGVAFDAPDPDTPMLVVRNKVDLTGRTRARGDEVRVSALTGQGIDGLRERIRDMAGFRRADESRFIARERHLDALERAQGFLNSGLAQQRDHQAGELLAEDLASCHRALGEITGEVSSDDLLGRIFSSFCIGK